MVLGYQKGIYSMLKIKNLLLPLSEADARELKLGDIVTVSGWVFTGRSRFHIRAIEEDILPPLDFAAINAFFHVGPVMHRIGGKWKPISIEPTSSLRFERYGGDIIRKLGLRTIIGKTTMGPDTTAALRDVGGVYLSKIGLCGNRMGKQVQDVCSVHFLKELGKTEATWVFRVDHFGPFFVAIDSHGNSYFEILNNEVAANTKTIEAALGIPKNYTYTSVSAGGTKNG